MKIREHRGGLRESMETVKECAPTIAAVTELVVKSTGGTAIPSDVAVRLYDKRPDERIGWDQTYIVMVNGYPWGFCDSPVPLPPPGKAFLEELRERTRLYGWGVDYYEIVDFVKGLYAEADLDAPCLTPYEGMDPDV